MLGQSHTVCIGTYIAVYWHQMGAVHDLILSRDMTGREQSGSRTSFGIRVGFIESYMGTLVVYFKVYFKHFIIQLIHNI